MLFILSSLLLNSAALARAPCQQVPRPLVVRARVVAAPAGVRFRWRSCRLGLDDAHAADGVLRRLLLLVSARFTELLGRVFTELSLFLLERRYFLEGRGLLIFRVRSLGLVRIPDQILRLGRDR